MIKKTIQQKGANDMSFVGLHNTEQGIIAFTDSKATKVFHDGHKEQDTSRKIKKLFHNQFCVIVTYGNNELFSRQHKVNLEDYFENNFKESTFYLDFFEKLYDELQNSIPEYNNGIYHFIIGSKDDNGYFIRELELDVHLGLKYSEKNYQYDAIFAGDDRYSHMYSYIPTYFDVESEIYVNIIKKQVEHLIDIFDLDYKYNSVGKPIETYIFK